MKWLIAVVNVLNVHTVLRWVVEVPALELLGKCLEDVVMMCSSRRPAEIRRRPKKPKNGSASRSRPVPNTLV